MRYTSTLACIAAIAACVSATPALSVPHSPTAEFEVTGPEYYLVTEVLSGDKSLGGLYVSAYHTGAGLNDAVLSDISVAAVGFLNGTFQEFDLGTEFQWGLYLAYDTTYTEWLSVQINAGLGGSEGFGDTDGTFVLTPDGLISTNPEWTGWIVCNWSHGVPQLFWQFVVQEVSNLPCNCATVKLCATLITP